LKARSIASNIFTQALAAVVRHPAEAPERASVSKGCPTRSTNRAEASAAAAAEAASPLVKPKPGATSQRLRSASMARTRALATLPRWSPVRQASAPPLPIPPRGQAQTAHALAAGGPCDLGDGPVHIDDAASLVAGLDLRRRRRRLGEGGNQGRNRDKN
jgi:hypothetical protein